MFRVVVVALKNGSGMSAKRLVYDGLNTMRGNDGLFRVSLDVFRGNEFFRDDHHSLAGFRLLLIFPTGTMDLRIALVVGNLYVNERHVGIERFQEEIFFARKRAVHALHILRRRSRFEALEYFR